MLDKIAEYRKAIAAILVPALATLAPALEDGYVSPQEWVWIVIAALGTGAVVGMVRNRVAAPIPGVDSGFIDGNTGFNE
jgi:hypothetical protein